MFESLKYFLLRLLTPVQKIMQSLGRGEPLMNKQSVDLAMSIIKDGDILLSYEKQRLTSFFIKGTYKHAAIVGPTGTDVIEAVGDKFVIKDGKTVNIGGVRKVDLAEWLYQMDYVAIIRPEFNDHTVNYLAACNALSFVGRPYDYEFKSGNQSIYCSELVFICYEKELTKFLDEYERKEILPQLFRDLCDDSESKFKLIYEFKG